MQEVHTFYEVLEIPETASYAEIKKAYRDLVQQYHPDKVPSHLTKLRQDAEAKFKQIDEAYKILSDSQKRGKHDEMLRRLRKEATGPLSPSPSSSATEPTSGASSGADRTSMPHRMKFTSILPAWLQVCLAIAFSYWGYLLFTQNRSYLPKASIQPSNVARQERESETSQTSADAVGKKALAESKRISKKAESIRDARSYLLGTWREEDGRWFSYFQDGTCEIVKDGENASDLNWDVKGTIITLEMPSGRGTKYSIVAISDAHYQFDLWKDPEHRPTLADAFDGKQWQEIKTATKLDSASTVIERDQLRAANLAKAPIVLPGVWKRGCETWRLFPNGTVHVWRKYSLKSLTVDRYHWRLSGDRLEFTDDLRKSAGGNPLIDNYLLLSVWDDYIGCGKLGSNGTPGEYGEMVRLVSGEVLQKQRDEELQSIARAGTSLLGAWCDEHSTFTFQPNGQCVVVGKKNQSVRETYTWDVNGALLRVGAMRFTIWSLNYEKLVLTQPDRHGNLVIEKRRL